MDDDLMRGADERPATTGPGHAHATDPHAARTDAVDEVQIDDLLEDVSIDGMCGVY